MNYAKDVESCINVVSVYMLQCASWVEPGRAARQNLGIPEPHSSVHQTKRQQPWLRRPCHLVSEQVYCRGFLWAHPQGYGEAVQIVSYHIVLPHATLKLIYGWVLTHASSWMAVHWSGVQAQNTSHKEWERWEPLASSSAAFYHASVSIWMHDYVIMYDCSPVANFVLLCYSTSTGAYAGGWGCCADYQEGVIYTYHVWGDGPATEA